MKKKPRTKIEQQFDLYNELYFNGKLSGRVRWAKLPRKELGEFEPPNIIRLNIRTRHWFSVWASTLLHEMAHLYTEGIEEEEHGPCWHATMQALLTRGAFNNLI